MTKQEVLDSIKEKIGSKVVKSLTASLHSVTVRLEKQTENKTYETELDLTQDFKLYATQD